MRKQIITLFFALNSIFALGQNLYLKASIGTNDLRKNSGDYSWINKYKNIVTSDIGVLFKTGIFKNKLNISTGLTVKYQPTKFVIDSVLMQVEGNDEFVTVTDKSHNLFIQVPIILDIKKYKRFNINVGLLNNIYVNKDKKLPYEVYILGGSIGVDYSISKKLSLSLSGYTDISPYLHNTLYYEYNLYNYGASFSVMYKIF
jgi:hypothetical protein